jgi:hypothetical protein
MCVQDQDRHSNNARSQNIKCKLLKDSIVFGFIPDVVLHTH